MVVFSGTTDAAPPSAPASIAVCLCTYNPNEEILKQALTCIAGLDIPPDRTVEYVIVDNNSPQPVSELPAVKSCLNQLSRVKWVRESKQGLTFARLAALHHSTAPVLVFFDDDNAPEPGYLRGVFELIERFPVVGVWGPGRIQVEYIGSVPRWIERRGKGYFQETDYRTTDWGCVVGWERYYPAGTGQVVRREVMASYLDAVKNGKVSAGDRTGASLASAGDGQIVWTAIKNGWAAGRSPLLRLRHLISASRCNNRYLARLAYGVSSSSHPAMAEVFPEMKGPLTNRQPTLVRYIAYCLTQALRRARRFDLPLLRIDAAGALGLVAAYFTILQLPPPWWVKTWRRAMGLSH
ncbi:hypothetical protein BH10PLA1_BH10PLA1_00710 [soil metagenome]